MIAAATRLARRAAPLLLCLALACATVPQTPAQSWYAAKVGWLVGLEAAASYCGRPTRDLATCQAIAGHVREADIAVRLGDAALRGPSPERVVVYVDLLGSITAIVAARVRATPDGS